MGHIAYQPPLVPIMFTIDTSGSFRVTVTANVVTLLGTVTVGGSTVRDLTGAPLPSQPADVTQLIICEKDSAEQRCEAYQIGTGRKLRIEMNGSFVQDVESNRITIDAERGSTIEVTDNGPPTELGAFGPARMDVEEFHFYDTSEETEVDLERSRSGTIADLSYDHISGELKLINGAKVATYDTYDWREPNERNDYPSEQECLQKRPEDWRAFGKDDFEFKYLIACVKTAEGDLGFLFLDPDLDKKPDAYYVYTYTWVR